MPWQTSICVVLSILRIHAGGRWNRWSCRCRTSLKPSRRANYLSTVQLQFFWRSQPSQLLTALGFFRAFLSQGRDDTTFMCWSQLRENHDLENLQDMRKITAGSKHRFHLKQMAPFESLVWSVPTKHLPNALGRNAQNSALFTKWKPPFSTLQLSLQFINRPWTGLVVDPKTDPSICSWNMYNNPNLCYSTCGPPPHLPFLPPAAKNEGILQCHNGLNRSIKIIKVGWPSSRGDIDGILMVT
jgi:hypothetical protein